MPASSIAGGEVRGRLELAAQARTLQAAGQCRTLCALRPDGASLPRCFDRFFRGDSSRCCDDAQHHGLAWPIVAAIARMHTGGTLAESSAGLTRVGFTLAAG